LQVFDPHGVCALLAPWNYALSIPMATLAPALCAGNAVVWKPGQPGGQMAALAVELMAEADIDPRLVQVLEGGAASGRALIDASPDHVTFVGSNSVGRQVAARCGELLIPSIIELGGKAPAIVLANADLERAARAIVFGRLSNAGASCIAIERVIAVDRVFDALCARVDALAEKLSGTLSTCPVPAQNKKLGDLRTECAAKGLTVEVTNRPHLNAWRDETFGALLPCWRVHSTDEAIHVANAHALQLSAYVFGDDKRELRRVARALKAPQVVQNDAMVQYAMMELPFGGRGASGYGRVHGLAGMRAYAIDRTFVEGHLPLSSEPWWLPYDERVLDGMLKALPTALRVWDRLR
jgi:succinate-semialdehyde dehydrogenase/glutarate-semialdehyde dehydrogenase